MYYIVKNWFSFVGENYKFTSPNNAIKIKSLDEAKKIALNVEKSNQLFLSCIIPVKSDNDLNLLEKEYQDIVNKIKNKKIRSTIKSELSTHYM